jgi:hypothetical protein
MADRVASSLRLRFGAVSSSEQTVENFERLVRESSREFRRVWEPQELQRDLLRIRDVSSTDSTAAWIASSQRGARVPYRTVLVLAGEDRFNVPLRNRIGRYNESVEHLAFTIQTSFQTPLGPVRLWCAVPYQDSRTLRLQLDVDPAVLREYQYDVWWIDSGTSGSEQEILAALLRIAVRGAASDLMGASRFYGEPGTGRKIKRLAESIVRQLERDVFRQSNRPAMRLDTSRYADVAGFLVNRTRHHLSEILGGFRVR